MDEPKSKSQKKRDAEALQKIGTELVSWQEEKLDLLPLSPQLRKAIIDAKKLKSHGAIRRQSQLIGKLMRTDTLDEFLTCYEQVLEEASAKTAHFHEIETWRTRLINEGKEALTEFISAHHPADVQHLRQLVKKAADEQLKEQNLGASKALFRYLRSCIQ